MATVVVILTSGTSWAVPSDFDPANNTIHVIGGGGGGAGGTVGGAGGGGGAARVGAGGGEAGSYARIVNYAPPGSTVTYQIGAAGAAGGTGADGSVGGETWFAASDTLQAQGGGGGLRTGGGGNRGVDINVGTTVFFGGLGGNGNAADGTSGGGGGGGGGAGGTTAVGVAGGTGTGVAGNVGGAGGATGGGAGGAAGTAGGAGTTWTTAGPGGGGGGGTGSVAGGSAGANAAVGGQYGAGGGGGGGGGASLGAASDAAAGLQGVIVIEYEPVVKLNGSTSLAMSGAATGALAVSVAGSSALQITGSSILYATVEAPGIIAATGPRVLRADNGLLRPEFDHVRTAVRPAEMVPVTSPVLHRRERNAGLELERFELVWELGTEGQRHLLREAWTQARGAVLPMAYTPIGKADVDAISVRFVPGSLSIRRVNGAGQYEMRVEVEEDR